VISIEELLSNQCNFDELAPELQSNLMELHRRINIVRVAWNRPMIVNSGYRSMEHHLDIYKRKGITDLRKIPLKSRHLFCQAVDISDSKRELQKWCKDNESLLVEVGLWCESFVFTKTWVHMQTVAPISGRRWFMP